MTARELLCKLSRLDVTQLEHKIVLEGCDCWGDAKDIEAYAGSDGPFLLMTRREEWATEID